MATLIENLSGLSDIQNIWDKAIKRCFVIYDVNKMTERGKHRHKESCMALTCIKGSVSIYVQHDQAEEYYVLNKPNQCLLLEPQEWRIMYNFSPDAVLVVYCSTTFDAEDYIDEPYFPVPKLRTNWYKQVLIPALWYTLAEYSNGILLYLS